MHLTRMIQKARLALNLKSQPFFQEYFSSGFIAKIKNWLWCYDVKKTCEHDVQGCLGIGSGEVE